MLLATADTTVVAAFAVGFISFLSPCVLPLVPGYLSAVSGVSIADMQAGEHRRSSVLIPALIFCGSFTLMFVALGMTATGLGSTLRDHKQTLDTIAGVMIIAMGVFFLLTPFVTFFTWIAPKIFGAEAGEIAVTAAGLQPFGAGLHLVLALVGAALVVSRVVGPRVRDRFWAARIGHADPWVHDTAMRLRPVPAGFLEPVYVSRALLSPLRGAAKP